MAAPARATIVDWTKLELWSPPLGSGLSAPNATGRQSRLVGSLVERVSSAVAVRPEAEYRMAGVRWYGDGVFHRETVQGAAISATTLTPLVPGALIYNRLFAWKGAFAVVPPELDGCHVSSEFPQFIANSDEVLASYLHLFFTREAVLREVARASSGSSAVSRNRFSERLFSQFELSLPDVTEQERLVRRWEDAKAELRAAREAELRASQDALGAFFEGLGIEMPPPPPDARPLTLAWNAVDRWGVDSNAQRRAEVDLSHGRFEPAKLDKLVDLVQYGTSAKANTTGDGTPVIRMGNLKDGRLDLNDLKFVRLEAAERKRLLLVDGDILFNRTNSKELVGKCAVFHEPGEYVFASYLIRVRVDTSEIDPDFLAYVLNSPIGRRQINALSRQIIGQANINAQELRTLETPLPPKALQRGLIDAASDHERDRVRRAEEKLVRENDLLQTAALGFT